MGHNSVVSGHPKSTGIPWVDLLSTGPPSFGASQIVFCLPYGSHLLYSHPVDFLKVLYNAGCRQGLKCRKYRPIFRRYFVYREPPKRYLIYKVV